MSLEHARQKDGRAPRLLSWAQLLQLVPYSRAHLSKLIKAGEFPAPLLLGPARPVFLEHEVADHIAQLPRESAAAPKNDCLARHNAGRRRKPAKARQQP